MSSVTKNLLLYIAKCVSAVVVLLAAGHALPHTDVSWVLISTLLVLSPDSKEAIPLAIVRVKANCLASAAAMLMLIISPSVELAICIAIALTIALCHFFHLMAGSRAALAAVIIISLHAPTGTHLWDTAFERVVSVVVGCGFAMLLTFIFHRNLARHLTAQEALNE